jgi:hypothetical protein
VNKRKILEIYVATQATRPPIAMRITAIIAKINNKYGTNPIFRYFCLPAYSCYIFY